MRLLQSSGWAGTAVSKRENISGLRRAGRRPQISWRTVAPDRSSSADAAGGFCRWISVLTSIALVLYPTLAAAQSVPSGITQIYFRGMFRPLLLVL